MYHCIPLRHFIFSVLGGHVINRSQYESTIPLTVRVCRSCLQYTSYINVIVRLLNRFCFTTSVVLRGYIVRVSYTLHYVTSSPSFLLPFLQLFALSYVSIWYVCYTNVWYMHWHCSIV